MSRLAARLSAARARSASYARRILVPRDERAARKRWGMAPGHIERLTPVLPDEDEARLMRWCTGMWPADEYLDLIPVRGRKDGG